MFEYHVYTKELVRMGLLQVYSSVQWQECYAQPGEVKIVAKATAENIALLIEGNKIYNPYTGTVARICNIQLIDDANEGQSLTVRAQSTAALLSERVVMGAQQVSNIEQGMYRIYSQNRRELPIGVAAAVGYADAAEAEIKWGSVLQAEMSLASMSELGFKVVFEPSVPSETFTVYKGVDRSQPQSETYLGYFGDDIGNIANISITTGDEEYKNVAVVVGHGEVEEERRVHITSLVQNLVGDARREMYVDAKDIKDTYQIATDTGRKNDEGNPIYSYSKGVYTEAEIAAIMDSRGREKLAEQLKSFQVVCDVTQDNMSYGTHYSLGDRVAVKLKSLGMCFSARVNAVTFVDEASGVNIRIELADFRVE